MALLFVLLFVCASPFAFGYDFETVYTYEGYDNLYDVGNSYMSEDCKKVAEVLELIGLKARDNYYALQIVGVFKGYTGFDPRIRTEREEAACLIADITSVHDISVIIHLPESQVRELYDEFVEKWERTGGVDGVREQYMVSVMLANWIQDTGYPNVPVNETFDDMLKLFWEISELSRPSVLELVSTPALPVDWPPEELARAISDSASKEELAGNLNTTLNEILQFEYGINDFAEKASGLEVHLKVALLIEDLHFLQFQ